MNILAYLDNKIEKFRENTGSYPTKIIMSKDTQKKIFKELIIEVENCWINFKNNYRGIKIELKKDIFIELK